MHLKSFITQMDKIMEGDLEPDEDDLEEISAEAIEQMQGMAASLQEEIMKAQADMQSAMMKEIWPNICVWRRNFNRR